MPTKEQDKKNLNNMKWKKAPEMMDVHSGDK